MLWLVWLVAGVTGWGGLAPKQFKWTACLPAADDAASFGAKQGGAAPITSVAPSNSKATAVYLVALKNTSDSLKRDNLMLNMFLNSFVSLRKFEPDMPVVLYHENLPQVAVSGTVCARNLPNCPLAHSIARPFARSIDRPPASPPAHPSTRPPVRYQPALCWQAAASH
jgi:hypothetical protein